ncbi:MAG: hypothetical protein ACREJO_06705 [Phycisphaerales bacterium]
MASIRPRSQIARCTNRLCKGAAILTTTVAGLCACSSIGPQTVVRDRFDYVTTISDSAKQQMLLNLVKVRYADAPVFMDVASVISSYSLEGDISLGGQVTPTGRSGDTFGAVGVTGRYADKPTITYQPLSGDKFAKSLMTPIPVAGILSLIQSGYPADLVLRICVNRINGLENAYGGSGNPREGNPKFRELMAALRESQSSGDSGFRMKPSKEGQVVIMFIRAGTDEPSSAARKVRELLGLDPADREFTVVPAAVAENDKEIAILTRSIFQIMIDFASFVDVPDSDVSDGRVYRPGAARSRTATSRR